MELAIAEMEKSRGPGPKVGAVLVQDGQVVSMGYRSPGAHAERAAIAAVQSSRVGIRGATLYTTLEPCVSVGSAIEPCAVLIARSGISTVVIGRYDANPRIYREGWKALRDARVRLRDFDLDLREKIDLLNATFAEHFVRGVGPAGGAKFDYQLNGGNFEIQYSSLVVLRHG
jgi:diaminohydroxyphosphoribosylaminopyrimidine deaminase/5-amino-6-(5-phosphoribosylamino)uracil reductase